MKKSHKILFIASFSFFIPSLMALYPNLPVDSTYTYLAMPSLFIGIILSLVSLTVYAKSTRQKITYLWLSPLYIILAVVGLLLLYLFFQGPVGHDIAKDRFDNLDTVKLFLQVYNNSHYPFVDSVDNPDFEIRYDNPDGDSYVRYHASFNSPILDLHHQMLECVTPDHEIKLFETDEMMHFLKNQGGCP